MTPTKKPPNDRSLPDDRSLLETCHVRSIELLRRNLTPGGVLAASPGARASKRGYTAIFGRDAAVCAIGMALSGDKQLERATAAGLHTLAEHQAPNGQIAKFVDLHRQEADFWYLGCIDSTLWWLIALAFLDRHSRASGLRRQYAKRIKLAVQWLLAQEHQRFFLLQQNEASDWADIMPRSGFVLYTNALWYFVKRLYGIAHAPETHENFNGLFHPFSAGIAEYRRATGRARQAKAELKKLARACALRDWAFTEWLHGKTLTPRGMPGQSWNAAAFLMAEHAVAAGANVFTV
jgi:hypothetical protein